MPRLHPPSTPKPDPHRAAFAAAIADPATLDALFPAALLIGAIEEPNGAAQWMREAQRQLEDLADRATDALAYAITPEERFVALARFLFETEGFAGNVERFLDPRNSCLHQVLSRRLGIPISLGVLMIAVGRLLRIPVRGIGAPGHFLTGIELGDGRRLFADPFNRGRIVDRAEAHKRVRIFEGTLDDETCDRHLRPAEPAAILARMLQNLKSSYAQHGRLKKLITTMDWIVTLQPANLAEIRIRGLALLQAGNLPRAVQDLACYVSGAPDADNHEAIRAELQRARAALAKLN